MCVVTSACYRTLILNWCQNFSTAEKCKNQMLASDAWARFIISLFILSDYRFSDLNQTVDFCVAASVIKILNILFPQNSLDKPEAR